MSYRVKTVATMTGISRPTLLAWERRHAILEPRRSESGYRIYTDDDVALLRRLKARVDAGHPIGEAVALARSGEVPNDEPLRDRLLDALLRYDRGAVDALGPSFGQLTFAQAIDDVLLPMLVRTGELWADGVVSIAQEHFVSAWCREQLMTMFHALGSGPVHGRRVVCAMPAGEQHDLGLLAVSVRLALEGWRVTWLGADLPLPELVGAVRAARPRLVCVSLMKPQPADQVRVHAAELRAAISSTVLVVFGGSAVVGLEEESAPGMLFAPTFPELQAALAALDEAN